MKVPKSSKGGFLSTVDANLSFLPESKRIANDQKAVEIRGFDLKKGISTVVPHNNNRFADIKKTALLYIKHSPFLYIEHPIDIVYHCVFSISVPIYHIPWAISIHAPRRQCPLHMPPTLFYIYIFSTKHSPCHARWAARPFYSISNTHLALVMVWGQKNTESLSEICKF